MAIKEVPITYRTYFKKMRKDVREDNDKLKKNIEELTSKINKEHNNILKLASFIKDSFNIDVTKYDEFNNSEYSTGEFYRIAKSLFMNKSNNYELVSDLFNIYAHANNLRKVKEAKDKIEFNNKLLALNMQEYNEIFKKFYTEVHKKLILDGYGYSFGNNIGWICINRCKINKGRAIDYAATKKREAEIIAQGKRVYNKKEADWCKRNGIEYIAEDKRVYKDDEYCYEIPLLDCKLPNGGSYKLVISDYRHTSIRGKSNDDLLKECNGDLNKICNLPVNIRTKVTMCDKVNKTLYLKFIRNENQKSIKVRKAYR